MNENEEHARRCPHCGGKTVFMHVRFNRKKNPHLLPSS